MGRPSFAIMTNHSPTNKVWLWVDDVGPKGRTEEARLALLNLEPLSSLSAIIQPGQQANNHRSQLFRDTIMASEHLEMKISSLQSTGSTLGKHEHVYRTEPITNQPISSVRKVHQGNNKRETEQSMLAYTQKMQDISARKGAAVIQQQSEHATSSPLTNNKGTGKRWATLHRLRRQTLDLKSVSDSHWNLGLYKRTQQQSLGPKGKIFQRPKSEVHLAFTTNTNNNEAPRRPRSDSDGVLYNSSMLHGKGYNNNVDLYPLKHGKLQGEPNILTLPDVTDSVESFNMDSTVQIVPFPGIEVQAVSLRLHSNSETLPKERQSVQNKVHPNHHIYKLSSQAHPPQVQSRKQTKKILKHQDKLKALSNGAGKQTVATETSMGQKPLKIKDGTAFDDESKRKKPHEATHQKSTTTTQPSTKGQKSTGKHTSNTQDSSSTNILESSNQDSTTTTADITLGIKSVLRTSANKKSKHRNSVHFGPQMVREVTKIVYPWNTGDHSSSEEDQNDSDEEDEELENDQSDSDSDYIYSDEDDNIENDL